jgi:hypothetical protein
MDDLLISLTNRSKLSKKSAMWLLKFKRVAMIVYNNFRHIHIIIEKKIYFNNSMTLMAKVDGLV